MLVAGEEGAILVKIAQGRVVGRHFSPSPHATETDTFEQVVNSAPKAPMLVVFDTMDQVFSHQTLPPVSVLSVNRLIERRLDREYGENFVRGALLFGKDKEGRGDWQFLMAAVQRSTLVNHWLDVVKEWPNPCSGITALPLEALTVIEALKAAREPDAAPDSWHLLVSYNKISGLRQAVFRNGKLVLARLGQPTADSTPEAIAGTIEQEITGTKQYLKRLGYQHREDLSLYIVVSHEIRNFLETDRLSATRVHMLTPYEAAEILGVQEAVQPVDRYGDVLIAAVIGRQPKPILAFAAPMFRRLKQLEQGVKGARVAFALLALMLAYNALGSVWDVVSYTSEIITLGDTKESKQAELAALNDKAAQSTEDLQKIGDVVELYNRLQSENFSPRPLLGEFDMLIGDSSRASEIGWIVREPPAAPPANAKPPASPLPTEPTQEVTMTLEFADELKADRKRLQDLVTDTLNAFKARLKGFDISYISVPDIVSDTKQIDVTLAEQPNAPAASPASPKAIAKLAIKGPLVMPKEGGANTNAAP